jgi:hypothetical protein
MTAEFPDTYTTAAELAEREAAVREAVKEFEGKTDADIEAEITRRQADLGRMRASHLETHIRVLERRLKDLRAELARREAQNG